MNINGMIAYTDGEFVGVENLRKYEGNGAVYFVGANANLEMLYNVLNGCFVRGDGCGYAPRYEVHPLMNAKRSYGLEIRDGKFCIVTAEKLVERILKW